MKGCKSCDRCHGIENGRVICERHEYGNGTISSRLIEIDEIKKGCDLYKTWEYKPTRGERFESITDYSSC